MERLSAGDRTPLCGRSNAPLRAFQRFRTGVGTLPFRRYSSVFVGKEVCQKTYEHL